MPIFSGNVLLPDRVADGWLHVEGGRIVDCGIDEVPEARPDATGWIVPSAVNAHTHAADTFLRDLPGKPQGLAELVGPGGWKHTHLRRAKPEQLIAGMQQLMDESTAVGAPMLVDFREGGLDGIQLARQAELKARIYGRPMTPSFDEDEVHEVLAAADGVGLSAMRDFSRARDVERWADAAKDARKPLAIHVSEGVREDMGRAVALGPKFVVHGCQGSRGDFDALANARIPLVVCPRSNRAFGIKPPVPAMLQAGVRIAIGTDNGMLQDGDVWQELGLLQAWFPALSDANLLRMATYNGRIVADQPSPQFKRGAAADWVVLPPRPVPVASKGRPALAPSEEPDAAGS